MICPGCFGSIKEDEKVVVIPSGTFHATCFRYRCKVSGCQVVVHAPSPERHIRL